MAPTGEVARAQVQADAPHLTPFASVPAQHRRLPPGDVIARGARRSASG